MTDQFAEIRDHFLAALERGGLEAQLQYAAEHCAKSPDLRAKLEDMLRAHHQPEGFLASRVGATQGMPARPQSTGTQIGPYKLLQQIGEGGMGTVYMAEQLEPVRRKVALKIIKPGMDTRQVIVRFEAERQALSLMDHPNIAKVLDAGTTESGRPYFVMELVKGQAITDYCDDRQLTPRQRLELLLPVCQAIQHAHQKGIIHRDIKPSNILVAEYDQQAVPKVIDFGVAKAISQPLTEKTMFTGLGQIVGTLEYMSPEQAKVNQLDIDTRSDIYSLGVLMYELLTGSTPFDKQRLQSAAWDEMLRIIREEEPPRPSTKLSSSETMPSVSANRSMEPARLSRTVRGELDWIVMKCLEKDRLRRYETTNNLALDVQRYLADEPVQACPPSAGYRLRKFVRRNKGPVLAASVVLLTLVAGIIGTTAGLIRAKEAWQAEAERAEAEQLAKESAEAVLDFVETRVFAAARPAGQAGGLGRDVTLLKAVEGALPFVETSFKNQPLIEARLRMTVGISFSHLAKPKTAAEQFEAARTIFTQQLGHDHPDTLRSAMRVASSYAALGRGPEAFKLLDETLRLQEAKLGPDHRDTLATVGQKGLAYLRIDRYPEALKFAQQALERGKAAFGREDAQTLLSLIGVAGCYQALGRHAEALKVLEEETMGLREEKVEPHYLLVLTCLQLRGDSHAALGQHARALKLRQETLEKRKARYGLDQPETIRSLWAVAESLIQLGRGAEAVPIIDEFVKRASAKAVHMGMIPGIAIWRLQYFEKTKDPIGCRATAEMWEKLNLADVNSLYNAACMRAVTAAVFRSTDKSPAASESANAEADRAMAWLKQAVAAGFNSATHIEKDTDLASLRDREDFKTLVTELKAREENDTQ